jgi:hypothetical protein
VYCQQERPFTREHVIPQWVRKILKTGPVEITKRSTGERVRYDQTLTLVVSDAVCVECNGGWMKRLGERVIEDVEAAIFGKAIALTPDRARILATWANERALMFELALKEARERWFAPSSNLRWLYAHRDDPTPSAGCQVWMAYLDATTALPAWSATGSWPDWLEQPEGYISCFSLGCAIFLVSGQDFREPDHRAIDGRSLARLELPSRYGGYVVPIWPDPDELVVWPPRFGLPPEGLTGFGNMADAVVRRPYPARLHRVDMPCSDS